MDTPTNPRRAALRWWQFGLAGGLVLTIATAVKLVRALIGGVIGEAGVGEAFGFAALFFGMGFLCGLVVWAGKGLYHRIGLAGDGVVGVAVLVLFFLACTLVFAPEILAEKFVWSGVLMLGLAVVLGAFGGAWTGRDVRKQLAARRPPPPNLSRFAQAQQVDYATALGELRRGRKVSHWMWYVFPQFVGLGSSSMSQTYAIRSVAEAEAYLAHPVLGPRLVECCEAVLAVDGKTAHDIFGTPDDLKLRSCVTLFAAVSPPGSVFERVLAKYYDGQPDEQTLRLLSRG